MADEKTGKKCPDCGIVMGRGKKHKKGCPRKGGSVKTRKCTTYAEMTAKDLLAERQKIDEALGAKQTELESQMKELKAILSKK